MLLVLFLMMFHVVAGAAVPDAIQLPVKNDPTIAFRLWFKVGSQNDPAGKEGLADITASMLTDASTKTNSYEQILDKLFPLAAGYNAITSVEMTVITGRIHKDNLATTIRSSWTRSSVRRSSRKTLTVSRARR